MATGEDLTGDDQGRGPDDPLKNNTDSCNTDKNVNLVLLGLRTCSIQVPREACAFLNVQDRETFQKVELNASMSATQEGYSKQSIKSLPREKVQHCSSGHKFSPYEHISSPKSTTHGKKIIGDPPNVAHDTLSLSIQQKNIVSGREYTLFSFLMRHVI